MLTTVAVPRSARWCGEQCSVPATLATGSQKTGTCARVSWSLARSRTKMPGMGIDRQLCFLWVRHLMDMTSFHHYNNPGGGDCPSRFTHGETEVREVK